MVMKGKKPQPEKENNMENHGIDDLLEHLTPSQDINTIKNKQDGNNRLYFITDITNYIINKELQNEGTFEDTRQFVGGIISSESGLEGYLSGIAKNTPSPVKIKNNEYREGYKLGFQINLKVASNKLISKEDIREYISGYFFGKSGRILETEQSMIYVDGYHHGKRELKGTKKSKKSKINPEMYQSGLEAGLTGQAPKTWNETDFMSGYHKGFIEHLETKYNTTIGGIILPNNPVQFFSFMEGLTQEQPQENLMDFSITTWLNINWGQRKLSEKQLEHLKEKELTEKITFYRAGKRLRIQYLAAQQ